jgi:uncharacterized protein YkwD
MPTQQTTVRSRWISTRKFWSALSFCLLQGVITPLALQAQEQLPSAPPAFPPEPPNTVVASQARAGLQIDPTNRQESINFYLAHYQPTQETTFTWNGNHEGCQAGEPSADFHRAVLQRINYFRAMAGVPADVALNATYNQKAQAAALMMSVNHAMDHMPPERWRCYTSGGAEAARHANLYLSVRSPDAIDGYMLDPGAGNHAVPHRRWLLYPQTQEMGTGDVPAADGYAAANALWVVDDHHYYDERPATRDGFVAWPPPGFVPNHLIFPRWSLSYPNANFQEATVSMTHNGQPLAIQVAPVVTGYGENTIVWEPPATVLASHATDDAAFTVTIANVRIGNEVRDFTYTVTAFAPPTFEPQLLIHRLYAPLVRQ